MKVEINLYCIGSNSPCEFFVLFIILISQTGPCGIFALRLEELDVFGLQTPVSVLVRHTPRR